MALAKTSQQHDVSFFIQIAEERWKEDAAALEHALAQVLPVIGTCTDEQGTAARRSGELCVVLTNDEEISGLNKTWRGKDGPTNVLSFPGGEDADGAAEDPVLGDIVLALETIAREASEQSKSFHNHTVHLMVHGVLHLLGYDHQSDDDAGQMEALERKILASLDIADPYGPKA